MTRRYLFLLLLAGGALLAAAACARVPDSGPVTHVDSGAPLVPEPAFYDPPGPKRGGSPVEIVKGFFGAMGAVPISTADAKEFLTKPAKADWSPEKRTVIYEGAIDVRLVGPNVVETESRQIGVLDEDGRFYPVPPAAAHTTTRLTLHQENEEWRIATPADEMYVDSYFFDRHYEPFSVYFVGPSGNTMVPVPLYLPFAEQPATALVREVLDGPPPPWNGELGSWVPAPTELDVSVPITSDGVAEVRLSGPLLDLTAQRRRLLSAQLVWTLSQVPGVSGVRILVDGVPLKVLGVPDVQDVQQWSRFDLYKSVTRDQMYALRSGRLVQIVGRDGARPMPRSLWGARPQGIRSFDIDLQLGRIVAVSDDGRRLLSGPVFGSVEGPPDTLPVAGHDLATPVATVGHQWLVVDRRPDGESRLLVTDGTVVRDAPMDGLEAQRVESLSLSPDGMRFAALTRSVTAQGLGPTRLMIGRVDRARTGGRIEGLVDPHEFVVSDNVLGDIRSVGWTDPTTLAVLARASGSEPEPYTVRIDGSALVNEWVMPDEIDPKRLLTSAGADEEIYLVERGTPEQLWFFDGAGWYRTDSVGLESLNFVG